MTVERTKEEVKAIRMANLKQNQRKLDVANVVPSDVAKIIHPHVKNLLNNAEFFLYVDEIKSWHSDHPDWVLKEDVDDINGIAMEKVIQFRLLLEKKTKKTTDIDKEYTSSKGREMVHRTNLGARRSTRISEGKSQNTTNNVVVFAGQIDDQKMLKIRQINEQESQEDDMLFPVKEIDGDILEE